MNPPDFDWLMAQLLSRLGLQPFKCKPKAYRLCFDDEAPIYCHFQPAEWLEVATPIGSIVKSESSAVAVELLVLQMHQNYGALYSIGMDKPGSKVSMRMRMRLGDCRVDDLLDTIQALRMHATSARDILESAALKQIPDQKASAGNTLARLGARHGIRC